jgi:hypothetical protein
MPPSIHTAATRTAWWRPRAPPRLCVLLRRSPASSALRPPSLRFTACVQFACPDASAHTPFTAFLSRLLSIRRRRHHLFIQNDGNLSQHEDEKGRRLIISSTWTSPRRGTGKRTKSVTIYPSLTFDGLKSIISRYLCCRIYEECGRFVCGRLVTREACPKALLYP